MVLKSTGGKQAATANGINSPTFPSDSETLIPFSFADYVTALQAKRLCEFNLSNLKYRTPFGITGITGDWSVPFVQCDSRQCEQIGQDAMQFCEYRMIALAPKNDETVKFKEWIYFHHPALETTLPFSFDFVQIFQTEEEIESYIKSPDYGNPDLPKIGGAIVIHSGAPSYKYSIRVNSTNFNKPEEVGRPAAATTPSTFRLLETFAKSPEDVCVPQPVTSYLGKWNNYCTGQYIYNGAITLQRLVDDWIIYDSIGDADKVAENGVSFGTFPLWNSADDGFASISGKHIPCRKFQKFSCSSYSLQTDVSHF